MCNPPATASAAHTIKKRKKNKKIKKDGEEVKSFSFLLHIHSFNSFVELCALDNIQSLENDWKKKT